MLGAQAEEPHWSQAVPAPPTDVGALGSVAVAAAAAGEGDAFGDFMNAFRAEMRATRNQNKRTQRFVPTRRTGEQQKREIEQCANHLFGFTPGMDAVPLNTTMYDDSQDEDDYDYWPDELVPLGVAMDEAEQQQNTTSSTKSGDSEESTPPTDVTTETTDSEGGRGDDWPLELLVG